MTMQPTAHDMGSSHQRLVPQCPAAQDQASNTPRLVQNHHSLHSFWGGGGAKVSEVIVDLSTIEDLGTSFGWLLEELGALQVCT